MIRKHLSALLSVTTALLIFTGIVPGSIASAQESEPIEILSMRSEYEKHYDNGDGTITAFVDTVPLHYNVDGEWIDIDNTLVQDESGNYVNKSNSMDVTLASSASVSTLDAVDEPLASIDYNGYSISWDFVSDQPETAINASMGDFSMPISYAEIAEKDEINQIDLGSNKLNKKASESVSKLTSSLSYDSLYENVDIDIDVMPSSVKETIILNDRDNVPEQFSYYVKAESLTAVLYEDNSVHFLNEADEDIFNIPAPYMFDSADFPENNYDIKVDIQEYEKGYLLTFIPDNDWIQSDERIYPVMISPDIQTRVINAGIDYSYISEQAPSSLDSNNYLRVGNQDRSGCQSFIKINNLFSNSSRTISTIYSANFCLNVPPNSLTSDFYVDVYSVNSEQSDVCWNNSSGFDNNTRISRFTITESAEYKQYAMNITDLVQYWLNNYNTGLSDVGIPNYGFKLATNSNSTMYLCCDSSSKYRPYFAMMYSLAPSFRTEYNPDKYNNFGKITNFQDRMNCYAYALQMYYSGSLDGLPYECYKLNPGELGISAPSEFNTYNIMNYGNLLNKYRDFGMSILGIVDAICSTSEPSSTEPFDNRDKIRTDKNFLSKMSSYSNFIEEQMYRDLYAMNFSLQRINCTSDFNLPSDFDESSERIIAMVTYYQTNSRYSGQLDFHFYVRNGNGTCPNGHDGTCSMWSHKQGNEEVKDNVFLNKLCDQNINQFALDVDRKSVVLANENDIRYYRITKDTDLFNSYNLNGHYSDSTGTEFYILP